LLDVRIIRSLDAQQREQRLLVFQEATSASACPRHRHARGGGAWSVSARGRRQHVCADGPADDGEEDIYRAVTAGAKGYLTKSAEWEDVLRAIRRIHAGAAIFPPEIAAKIKKRKNAGR
jgi:hypothetical protein